MVTFARIAKSIPIPTLKTVNPKAKSDPVTTVEPANKFCKMSKTRIKHAIHRTIRTP